MKNKSVFLLWFFLLWTALLLEGQTQLHEDFTWTASTSNGVAGYQLDCGTAAGSHPWTSPINGVSLVTGTSYLWLTGTPGVHYYCVARAVDNYQQVSPNSNEWSGTYPLPSPPSAPSNLTGAPQ